MIAFQNVSFGYNRRRKVFADLSLTFGEGHIHGLLGRNGTGKSTLLQLICGLLEPDTGHIVVDGFTPRQRSVDFLSRLMLIPEELSLPNIPLRRFASHTGAFYPGYSAEMFESHCEALEIDPSQNPHDMSMGQRKKGYIAFALACNPQFLLLDEPTNGLDIPSKTILRSLLAAYADEKRTIVISTHQVREVENLIDKIVILDEQGLVLAATTEELSHRLTFGPLPADAKAIYSTPSFSGEEGIALNTTGRESRPDLELIFAATTHDRTTIPSILHTNPTNHE